MEANRTTQREPLKMSEENRQGSYFLVTSYGRSATFWIAKILHDHPNIICSHGPGFPPFVPDMAKRISEQAVLEMHKNMDNFHQIPLKEVLLSHKQLGDAKVYGNVHGYSANSVHIMTAHDPTGLKVKAVNIIRHPVTRIESFKNRMFHEFSYNHFLRDKIDSYMDSTVDKNLLLHVKNTYGMSLSLTDKLFVYALCLVPFNDRLDLATEIPSIPMERITKDPEVFCWMFDILTDGIIAMDSDYLTNAYKEERLNALSADKHSLSVYQSWAGWMRDSFAFIARKHDFQKLYHKYGYSFSFIENH